MINPVMVSDWFLFCYFCCVYSLSFCLSLDCATSSEKTNEIISLILDFDDGLFSFNDWLRQYGLCHVKNMDRTHQQIITNFLF